MRSSFIAPLAAISVALAPAAASAGPPSDASALSLASSAGARLESPNQLEDSGLIIAGLVAIAVIIIFFVLIDDDDEDAPTSP